MKNRPKHTPVGRRHQSGFTLIELLVAGMISVISVSAMVIVMGNTMGTGSQSIQMTRLSQELRASMQIITRELRRANYHATYLSCFGNVDCRTTLGITTHVNKINVTNNGDADCLWFWYDRPQTGTAVAVTGETVAGFRLASRNITGRGTVGVLQMTTTTTAAPNCNTATGWQDITDDDFVDVNRFNICNTGSFEEFVDTGNYQNVQMLTVRMEGTLIQDTSVPTWIKTNANASRELEEVIVVRNHLPASTSSPPTIIACT